MFTLYQQAVITMRAAEGYVVVKMETSSPALKLFGRFALPRIFSFFDATFLRARKARGAEEREFCGPAADSGLT
jgi:hypothetical protein